MYHQYIKLEAAVNSVLEAGDDTSLQYQLERLRPAVARLCRAVSSIPVITAKERLSQSEIAKKVKQTNKENVISHSFFPLGCPSNEGSAQCGRKRQ